MNSKVFADKSLIFLKKHITYETERDEHLVHYGLQALYIMTTKMILITILAIILGIAKEMYIFTFFYAILRLYASGMHLSTSMGCNIFSSITLLGFTMLSIHTNLFIEYRIIIAGLSVIIFSLYSPADTRNKPIINSERRLKHKIISILLCLAYLLLILIIKSNLILNCITYAMITQTILILPITYKIFKQPYNNYKNYKVYQ